MWTREEEAKKLADRFNGVNRAKFAREHKLKGGQAMIYNHINALSPISRAAALIYAKAFGCSLEEISPRLAADLAAEAATAAEVAKVSSPAGQAAEGPSLSIVERRRQQPPEITKDEHADIAEVVTLMRTMGAGQRGEVLGYARRVAETGAEASKANGAK